MDLGMNGKDNSARIFEVAGHAKDRPDAQVAKMDKKLKMGHYN